MPENHRGLGFFETWCNVFSVDIYSHAIEQASSHRELIPATACYT